MFWLSALTQIILWSSCLALALLHQKKRKKGGEKKKQMFNTIATPRACEVEKGTARAWGAHGCFFPGCRFDSPPEQRNGGCSGCVFIVGQCSEEQEHTCGTTHTILGPTFCPEWENTSVSPHSACHHTVCALHLPPQHKYDSLWLHILQ